MEVGDSVQDTSGHSASLLTRLNLQREQAQFCDCVVRQKQSPAQLYPAHRCVLAASSPVLGSVLSSSGALVELQAPCLSGSVLAPLLDYIYTGALPCACTQQQYYSLLAAAHYLQMDRLLEALHAWEQSEACAAAKTYISTENESQLYEKICYSQSCSIDPCGKLKETEICSSGSLENSNIEITAGAQMPSASRDLCVKEAEPDATIGAKQRRKDAHDVKYANTSKSGRAAPRVTQNISSTTEGYSASRVHKDTQKDQFHPAGTIKPETWQNNADEEMEGTDEDTRSSSSSPRSPSPQPCCGAVPVICHSSRASAFQVCTAPAHCAVSQAAAKQPASAAKESTTTEHNNHSEDNSRRQTGTKDCSDGQLASQTCCKCIKDQTDTLIEESSSTVPLPVEGSDSNRWDVCLKGEVKEEHVFSGKRLAEKQALDSHSDLYGPDTAQYSRLQRAEASAKEVLSNQHKHAEATAALGRRNDGRVGLPLSNESRPENATGGHSEFECGTEPLFGFTSPEGSDASDPTCSVVGQSYHGHVHYHCIAQGDAWHLSDADDRHSHPGRRDSDQSSEEEETCVRQHFTAGPPEQFLLLDISTRHAELLVSYKDRADQEQQGTAFDRNSVSGAETKNNDGELRTDEASAVWPETRNIQARTNMEVQPKPKIRETCVKERNSAAREQSPSRAEVTEEASKRGEDANQTSTSRMCWATGEPESAQASVSSTLSVCIPSALPASMSASISARLSTPAHQAFQCSLCDRSFSQRGSLNRHVRSHLGVRPFPCPRCPMTFSRQYRVTEHMRVHQRCTLGSDFPQPPASSM